MLAPIADHRVLLAGREHLPQQPSPALGPEQVGVRAGRDEVGMQDRLENDRARCRTIWVRRVTCRRSASVRWSGTQTSGRKPLA